MKLHRIYTLFRNLTFALFPAVLTLFSGGEVVFFAVVFLLFVAAVVLAFVFPVRQDEPLENSTKAFFGFFGGIGLLVMLGFVLVVGVVAVDAVTSGPVETEFSCTTTEFDFLRFALSHGYALETNRFVNANATCNPNGASSEWNASMWAGKSLSAIRKCVSLTSSAAFGGTRTA